jgi:hypothetical protein
VEVKNRNKYFLFKLAVFPEIVPRVMKSRNMRWAYHVAHTGKRNAYTSEGKTPLRRAGRRWEDNIKMVLEEIGWKALT